MRKVSEQSPSRPRNFHTFIYPPVYFLRRPSALLLHQLCSASPSAWWRWRLEGGDWKVEVEGGGGGSGGLMQDIEMKKLLEL